MLRASLSTKHALLVVLLGALHCISDEHVKRYAQGQPQYIFVGYGNATEARQMCKKFKGLPMPKTVVEQNALQAAINASVVANNPSHAWPNTTVWIGGRWIEHEDKRKGGLWEWDDGTPVGLHLAASVNLARMVSSARLRNATHANKPWMCSMLDGLWKDSEVNWSLGIFCEAKPKLSPIKKPEVSTSGKSIALTTVRSRTTTTTTNTFMLQRKRDEAVVGGIVGGAVGGAVGVGLLGGLLGAMTTTAAPTILIQTSAPMDHIIQESTTFGAVRIMTDKKSVTPGQGWNVLLGCFLVPVLVAGIACLFVMQRGSSSNRGVETRLSGFIASRMSRKVSHTSREDTDESSQSTVTPVCEPLVTDKASTRTSIECNQEIEMTFCPGKIGMEVTGGRVDAVHEGGQADKLGVQVGWIIKKVNGLDYTKEILQTVIAHRSLVSVVFQGTQVYWE